MKTLLKAFSLVIALLFLGGAVLTAMSDRAVAAEPVRDAGPRPRARDGGTPVYFPASKSPGAMELRIPAPQQSPQQNSQ